jgi:pimeloyl-ACP methyl ester carboxylesterase/thiol-disulfide isomerase/thioredoxin
MKLLTILCMLVCTGLSAQVPNSPFSVHPAAPQPGEKVTIVYKNDTTVLRDKKSIGGVIYTYTDFKWQASDLRMKRNDTAWISDPFSLPAHCALLVCTFEADNVIDNGKGFPYTTMTTVNKKQLPGAYYAWGMMRNRLFAREVPFAVDSSAYIENNVSRMWFRYELRDHPTSRPYIFLKALTLYKKTSDAPETDDNIRKELTDILGTPGITEQVWIDAQQVYANVLHDNTAADSIKKIILANYPKGITARDAAIIKMTRETDAVKKQKDFEQFISDFPPARFKDIHTTASDLYYSKLFRSVIYTPIIKDSNYSLLYKYLPYVPTSELSTFYHHMVEIPLEQKKTPIATLQQLSDLLYKEIMNRPADVIASPAQWKKINLQRNAFVVFTHSKVLYETKQYRKALETASLIAPQLAGKKAEFNELYVRLLQLNKQDRKITDYVYSAAKENALTPFLIDLLHKDYVKLKKRPAAERFEDWLNSLKSEEQKEADRKKILSELVNLPIAPFKLQGMDGSWVDMASLKGKVIVVDFWATWCAPCKAAMPGMQMAVNKFSQDSSVKFYFVATMEKSPDYKEQIRRFISSKKYPFNVLFDGENKETGEHDEVYSIYSKAYKISGIPLKIIIDQQGRLRWINTGYYGSPSGLADEISFIVHTLQQEQKDQAVANPAAQRDSLPYTSTNVQFYNGDKSISFGGTLTIPRQQPVSKTVILLSGTGKQDRDGTMAGQKFFAAFADSLSRKGIAVLRTDDRGTGETTGVYENATTEDFANDALAAVHFLQQQPELANSRIGLAAHSEGAAAAMIAASKSNDIKFLVSLSGLASKGLDALLTQNRKLVADAAIPELNKTRSNSLNELLFTTVYNYATSDSLEQKIRETYANWKIKDDRLIDSLKIENDHFRFFLESYVKQATGNWYRFHIRFDPATYLRRVNIPSLIIYGDKDLMLDPEQNIANWKKYANASNPSANTFKTFKGLNHLLQSCNTCSNSEYAQLKTTMSPAVVRTIIDWINAI